MERLPDPIKFELASWAGYYDDRTHLPLDAWVRNSALEDFLASAVHAGGIATLTAQYGFQCSPRKEAVACSDCHVCSKTERQAETHFPFPILMCLHVGDMQMHVEVGPGRAVTAMTYWKAGNRLPTRDPPVR